MFPTDLYGIDPEVLNDIVNGSNPNCGMWRDSCSLVDFDDTDLILGSSGFTASKGWDPVTVSHAPSCSRCSQQAPHERTNSLTYATGSRNAQLPEDAGALPQPALSASPRTRTTRRITYKTYNLPRRYRCRDRGTDHDSPDERAQRAGTSGCMHFCTSAVSNQMVFQSWEIRPL